MQRLKPQHVSGPVVAVGCIALAMANGGFDATGFAAASLAVWAAAVVLIAAGAAPRAEPPRAAIVAGLCLAGFSALIALSMLWGNDAGHAFEDIVRALFYLGTFVLVVIGAARGEARSWLGGLAAGLAGVAAIALIARFEPSLFGNPDADIASRLPSALGRLTYPIGYWNGLAAAMSTAIVVLVWFGSAAASRIARALAVAAIPVTVLALWMTQSRGGIVAAAIAFAILVLVGPARSRLVANLGLGVVGGAALIVVVERYDELLNDPLAAGAAAQGHRMLVFTIVAIVLVGAARYALDSGFERFRVSRRLAVVATAVIAVIAVIGIVRADPVGRFDEFKAPPSGAEAGLIRSGSSGRYQFWSAAVDAFAGAPLGGVGAAGYTPYWLQHRDIAIPATRAHSLLLESMAELGIVGLALILGFFAVAAVTAFRRARAPAAVAGIAPALAVLTVGFVAAAVDWTWDLPAVFGPAVLAAALLVGPATLPADGGTRTPVRMGVARSRRRFARGVAVLLVAWISICASVLLLLEDRKMQSSRSAAADGDLVAALDAANQAADLEPWAAEPRTQLALVYERRADGAAPGPEQEADLADARDEINAAIDRAPDDYQLYLIAARLDAKAQDLPAGIAKVDEAVRLNPLDPTVQQYAELAKSVQ